MSLEVKRSWNTNISVTSLLNCNEYTRMYGGYGSSGAHLPSPIISYRAFTVRPFSDTGTPSFSERAGKHCVLEGVMGGLGSRFDTSATSLHTRNRYLHATVSWAEKMMLLLGGNGLLHKLGCHCGEPYVSLVFIYHQIWVGGSATEGCLNTQKTPVSCRIRFPPIIPFPFPLIHHLY